MMGIAGGSLQIQNKIALQLAEGRQPQCHHTDCACDAGQPGVGPRHEAIHDQAAQAVDIVVQRIELDDLLHEARQLGQRVKQRRGVHPGHGQNAVEVLQVTEVDRQRPSLSLFSSSRII